MDLFSSHTDIKFQGLRVMIVNCVSADLHMGKGIAVEFRDRYGNIPALKSLNPIIGDVLCFEHPLKDRVMIPTYLVTKPLYYQKPTYDILQVCLAKLETLAIESKADIIVMPRIACGLDRLDWNRVSLMISPSLSLPYIVYDLSH